MWVRDLSATHAVGLKRKPLALIKRLRKAKKEAPPMEKPACVKTHLRNMIIVPEMIGSVVGIHQGKTFNQVEIKVLYNVVCCYLFIPLDSAYRVRWWVVTWVSSLSRTSQ